MFSSNLNEPLFLAFDLLEKAAQLECRKPEKKRIINSNQVNDVIVKPFSQHIIFIRMTMKLKYVL